MKPNIEQLDHITSLRSDHVSPIYRGISQEIWDYVEGELNKIYSLPDERGNRWGAEEYCCKNCLERTSSESWHQEIIQNVTQLTCPECGAIHSEMIKGE